MIGFPKHNFIDVTRSDNKFHKKARILGDNVTFLFDSDSNCIVEEGVTLRGDLGKIDVANFVVFKKGCVLKPPPDEDSSNVNSFKPVQVGSYSIIGENTVCSAISIGSFVKIGKNCVIGDRVLIRDCVEILDNTIIPADTILPPLTIFGGNGEFQKEAPECQKEVVKRECEIYIKSYIKTFSV